MWLHQNLKTKRYTVRSIFPSVCQIPTTAPHPAQLTTLTSFFFVFREGFCVETNMYLNMYSNVSPFWFKCYHYARLVPLLFYLTYLGDSSCVTQNAFSQFLVESWSKQNLHIHFIFLLIYNFLYPLFFYVHFFFQKKYIMCSILQILCWLFPSCGVFLHISLSLVSV